MSLLQGNNSKQNFPLLWLWHRALLEVEGAHFLLINQTSAESSRDGKREENLPARPQNENTKLFNEISIRNGGIVQIHLTRERNL